MTHRVRYTQGPETLTYGENAAAVTFKRGEWRAGMSPADAEQLTRPERVAEYGFDAEPPIERTAAAPAAE